MGRKKKRSPQKTTDTQKQVHAISSSSKNTLSPVQPAVDVISVRLFRPPASSFGSTTKLHASVPPRVAITEHDAGTIDVLKDESVIILTQGGNGKTIVGATVCKVDVIFSSRSPSKMLGKRKQVCPGSIEIMPDSILDAMLPNIDSCEIISQLQTPSISSPLTPPKPDGDDELVSSASKQQLPSPSQPGFSFKSGGGGDELVSSASKQQLPSPSQPGFSFKSGGGGDELVSSASKQHLSPPSKPSGKALLAHNLWVIPVESSLGRRVSNTIFTTAATLRLRVATNNETTGKYVSSEQLIKRVFLAHCVGRYVQNNEHICISFQGRPLQLKIESVAAASAEKEDFDAHQSLLPEKMANLKINESGPSKTSPLTPGDDTILQATASSNIQLFEITHDTAIVMELDDSTAPTAYHEEQHEHFVVGLSSTLQEVRSLLTVPLTRPDLFTKRSMKPPRGVLLHGPSGVGKSCLAKQIAADFKSSCEIEYVHCPSLQSQTAIVGAAERRLSRLFRSQTGSQKGKLLIFDDIHLICGRRGTRSQGSDQLASTFLALLDGIGNAGNKKEQLQHIVVLAVTRNPSSLDPALRRPGRIDAEVEVPIPDEVSTRSEILRFHVDRMGAELQNASESSWMALAKLAKGFNGADCMLAVKEAIRSTVFQKSDASSEIIKEHDKSQSKLQLSFNTASAAIRATKPSAIQSITVEIPRVYWSDIGGMESVKKKLRECIDMPQEIENRLQQIRVSPPRGILLYGPPGCSKTLMARALATEGEMNFLAVKGPELLSKWLGESERALASLFRRARMASPSIIFFDEIDAIASKRGFGDSASGGRLLSQLLTELDGVKNGSSGFGGKQCRVVVVGATNRPDLLDSALTRPGRIDRMVFVGIPDEETRSRILELNLRDRSCSDDIDIGYLASAEISEGFSGAEMVAICRDASLLALEACDNELGAPRITMRHLLSALNRMRRQITPEMLAFYDDFRKSSKP